MQPIGITDLTSKNIRDYGICSYKNPKTPGYNERTSWIENNFKNDLKLKAIITLEHGMQGFIEYIPAEHCWRPVEAAGYTFIHCLFVGFKKEYKDKGYASMLIDECIKDSKRAKKSGVAIVTRKTSFMVGSEIFLKKGFMKINNAPPDFELLALKFNENTADPKFKIDFEEEVSKYKDGLYIIRADQCPYTVKNVNEIVETSKNLFGISPKVINLNSAEEAQKNPCAFGTFSIIYNGEVIAYHPISKTRFSNIMHKLITDVKK
jgi:hypothetical protein